MNNGSRVKMVGVEGWPGEVLRAADFDVVPGQSTVVRIGRTEVAVGVIAKQRVDPPAAHAIVASAANTAAPRPIVIAGLITEVARDILTEHGIDFVDGAGHARINLPGLIVRTGGLTADAVVTPPPPTRLAGKSGLIAEALLIEPDRDWRVGDVADRCSVSSGLAHRVLARLQRDGVVGASGAGPTKVRRLASPAALLDVWAEEETQLVEQRQLAYRLSLSSDAVRDLSGRLDMGGVKHAIAGVTAARRRVSVLTASIIVTCWIGESTPVDQALGFLDARPVDEGANLVLMRSRGDLPLRFSQRAEGVWVTSDPRIYLEARADPRRGREQAQAFRAAVLGY